MSKEKITWDVVIEEYMETFKCLGIFFEEPSGTVPLLNGNDGAKCYSLENETPESIHERIERSKKAGRNLFFEELPEYTMDYIPKAQY